MTNDHYRLRVWVLIGFLFCSLLFGQGDLHTRPDPEGVPTEVFVALFVIDIEAIEDRRQQFTADVFIRLTWKDGRLAGGLSRLGLQEIWHPQTYLFNQRSVRAFLPDTVEVTPEGTVSYGQRYYGEFTAPLDLKEFPFDSQSLPITMVSFRYGPDEVKFIFEAERTGRAARFSATEWDIGGGAGQVGVYRAVSSHQSDREFLRSRFDYTYEARRYVSYYVWKVILPLIFIVLMSWAVFFIDPTQVAPQLGVAATSILTLIAFFVTFGHNLPRISYLTQMDHFVYASLALVFLAFVEALTTCYLAVRGSPQASRRLDRISRLLFPACFLGINIWFWI